MNALIVASVLLLSPQTKTVKPKMPPFEAFSARITYYCDTKGERLKEPKRYLLTDRKATRKLELMFKEAINKVEGSKPAAWKAGYWVRFEDNRHRSREIGFNPEMTRWSWGKGDFAVTKEMKAEVLKYFGKAASK